MLLVALRPVNGRRSRSEAEGSRANVGGCDQACGDALVRQRSGGRHAYAVLVADERAVFPRAGPASLVGGAFEDSRLFCA